MDEIHSGRPGIPIFINGKHYFAPCDRMTGRELKALAGIPEGNRIYLEVPGPRPDTAVPDELPIELEPGMKFYDLPPGIVGRRNQGVQEHQGRPGISIIINGRQTFAPKQHLTGAEVKALGGIPVSNRLYLDEPGDKQDIAIGDDDTAELKPGQHYYDLPPAVVGALAPIVQAQIDRVREEYPDLVVTEQPDGSVHIEIAAVPTGPTWNMPTTPLLIILPPGYPDAARPSFCAHPGLLQRGGQPAGSGVSTIAGRQWMTFCWQPAGPLDFSGREGLWKFIKFALRRFVEA